MEQPDKPNQYRDYKFDIDEKDLNYSKDFIDYISFKKAIKRQELTIRGIQRELQARKDTNSDKYQLIQTQLSIEQEQLQSLLEEKFNLQDDLEKRFNQRVSSLADLLSSFDN